MTDQQKSFDEIKLQLEDIWAQLRVNEQALENEEPFQTDGLEAKVKKVCADVTALPKDIAIVFEPELTKMIEFLTELSEKMQQKQAALRSDSQHLNQREKALNAYKKQAKAAPSRPKDSSNPEN